FDQRPNDLRPLGPVELVHIDTMREHRANCVAHADAPGEIRSGRGRSPASLSGLASAIPTFLGSHRSGSGLPTFETSTPTKLNRSRVLFGHGRIRLALAGGEVHHGFGELVRVTGHSGA